MRFNQETIAAVASPHGSGLRGIIRISGPRVIEVLTQVMGTRMPECHPTRPRRYAIEWPIDQGTQYLPADLFLWPTSRSFTGESLAELHMIGSLPLLNEVLEGVCTSGARPAQPGEFTLKAYLSGRIDLVQAEAVLAVIDAANDRELETALSQLAGGISRRIADFREQLLLQLADLEAGLDFVEEDIEFVDRRVLRQRIQEAGILVRTLLESARTRMRSSGSHRIVLAGLPNAGKSFLFNRLSGRERALVSSIPGTTRDYLTTELTVAGLCLELVDTAGWETPRDGIEQAAAVLRQEQYSQAHLVVWCSSGDLEPEAFAIDRRLLDELRRVNPHVLEVRTKADRLTRNPDMDEDGENALLSISAVTGQGLDQLLSQIAQLVSQGVDRSEMIGATAARCGESLQHALTALTQAETLTQQDVGDELIALELRNALNQLARIAGDVDTEEILDRIFSRFCIGK